MSSFHLYISCHLTLLVSCVPLEIPLAYNMYLFNLRIVNYINKDFFFVMKILFLGGGGGVRIM